MSISYKFFGGAGILWCAIIFSAPFIEGEKTEQPSVLAENHARPVVEAPINNAVRTSVDTVTPTPEVIAPPEVSNTRHTKIDKEYYTSPSIESTDPVGNLSSSETYSLCSEACSAMSNGSSSTYTDCVRACTKE